VTDGLHVHEARRCRGRRSGFGLELPWGERSGARKLAATRAAPRLPAIARSEPLIFEARLKVGGPIGGQSAGQVGWKRGPHPVLEVDNRVVVSPRQARELLAAATYVGAWELASGRRLRAIFGCLYYAATRPGEALGLRRSDCDLPEAGWGRITVEETGPSVGRGGSKGAVMARV
jgi:integrase